MNIHSIRGNWKQLRGQVRQQWGRLTDDEIDQIGGRFDRLSGYLEDKYGYSKEKAMKEVDKFIKRAQKIDISEIKDNVTKFVSDRPVATSVGAGIAGALILLGIGIAYIRSR
jgi:uncharacterized protein YjbJ (UPF0337 family)